MKFNEWLKINEGKKTRSQKSEVACPHPENKEYCKKWNDYLKGEGKMPVWKDKKSIGHYQGPRASTEDTLPDKKRKKSNFKGGRYDWRKDGSQ